MTTAVVTGVTGQDGIYLARALAARGLRVVGTATPRSARSARVGAYLVDVEVVALDLQDTAEIGRLIDAVEPEHVYNLAAVSSVGRSWDEPELTQAVNLTAVEAVVDAAIALQGRTGRPVRLFQASSSEVDGSATSSPYARSKAAAEDVVRAARDERGLHACYGRLYIHESPVRAESFVSRKITRAAAAIARGVQDKLVLGNLDVVRDWGFAGDYVEAVRLMLEADDPLDLPIGSGVPHSLADLVSTAFRAAGLEDGSSYVVQDPALVRPADTAVLLADPEPAARALGWRASTSFEDLVSAMVRADLLRLDTGLEEDARYLGR